MLNSEITEILNNTILQNKVSGEDEKVPRVSQSDNEGMDDITSLFMSLSKEHQLIEAEKLLAQGLTPGEVRIRMALGS